MEGRLGSLAPVFRFSFSFGVVVTPRILKKELEWDSPLGCSSFSLRGCPASALAVAGNGCRVLQAGPFFGTVTLFPSETLRFPSYAPRCRLRRSVCACLGLRSCSKCLRLCFFFFFFFYEWEHRTGTMCPFSSLHPLRKGKEV